VDLREVPFDIDAAESEETRLKRSAVLFGEGLGLGLTVVGDEVGLVFRHGLAELIDTLLEGIV